MPIELPIPPAESPMAVVPPLSIRELTAVLIRHHGLVEGQFDLLLEYQFGAGAFGPTADTVTPGVVVGIAKIGLARAVQKGPLTVDAAELK